MRKKKIFKYLFFLVIFMAACVVGEVDTAQARVVDKGTTHYVSGEIGVMGETTTWLEGNTYVLCCTNGTYETPYVTGNLVIEPGAIIEFGNSYRQGPREVAKTDWNEKEQRYNTYMYTTSVLYITTGNIKAEGTADNPIIFRLTDGDKQYTNGWEGLSFEPNADITDRYGIFKYCQFEQFGNRNYSGVYVDFDNSIKNMNINLEFDNCTFESGADDLVKNEEVAAKAFANNAICINNNDVTGTLTINNCTFSSKCLRDVLTIGSTKMSMIAKNNKFDGTDALVNFYGTGDVNVSSNTFCVRNKNMGALDLAGAYNSTTFARSVIIEGNTYDAASTDVANYYPVSFRVESEVNAPSYKEGAYVPDTFSDKYPENMQKYRMIGTIAADKTCTVYSNLCKTIVTQYLDNYGTIKFMPGLSIDYGTNGCQLTRDGASIIAEGTKEQPITIYGTDGNSYYKPKSVIVNYCDFKGMHLNLNRTDGCVISVKNSKFSSEYCHSGAKVINVTNAVDEATTSKAVFENIYISSYYGIQLTDANNVEFNNCVIKGKNTTDYAIGITIDGSVADGATSPIFNNLLIYNEYMGVCQNSDTYSSIKLNNCTISNCKQGMLVKLINLKNSIIYGSSEYDIRFIGDENKFGTDYISNCCIGNVSSSGQLYTSILLNNNTNLIKVNPQFVDSDNNDYHLKSPYGRWNGTEFVTTDTVLSPCINAGSTDAEYSNEKAPNGDIVNMGYYGNTAEASKFNDKVTYILNTDITGVTDAVYGEDCKNIATSAEDAYYVVTSVSWSPDVLYRFDKNKVYIVTIKLRANNRQSFASNFTATINGKNAVVTENTGDTVTLTYTYPSTGVTVTASSTQIVNGTVNQINASVSPADRETQSQEVTWSSSDETVASVDSEGKVTAKKVGIVTITATANDNSGKLGTIKLYVKPAAISSLKAAVTAYNSIKLTWSASAGATSYNIYRATSKNGTYSIIKSGCTALTYTDSTCSTGTTYYYKIVASANVTEGDSNQKLYSPDSAIVYATPVLKNVTGSKASCYNYNTNKITWSKVAGATGYVIYRATSKNGSYSKIATISSGSTTTYYNKSLATNTTYYYKVKAYRKIGTKYVYSPNYGTIVYAKPVLKTPTGVKAACAGYASIKVSWNLVDGATGYKIYRATSKNGSYKLIKTITNNKTKTFTNTSLTTGKTYYYKVVAYRKVSSTKTVTTTSAKVNAYTRPATPSIKTSKVSSTKIKVTWGKISGASGYVVYRATSKTGKYSAIKTITSGKTITYSNSGLKKGKTYYYKVRAYRTVSGKRIYSFYSTIKYTKL